MALIIPSGPSASRLLFVDARQSRHCEKWYAAASQGFNCWNQEYQLHSGYPAVLFAFLQYTVRSAEGDVFLEDLFAYFYWLRQKASKKD